MTPRPPELLLLLAAPLGLLLLGAAGADPSRDSPAALPASRAGHELLGRRLDLAGLAWIRRPAGAGPDSAGDLGGRVTLVRWFTDGCRFCARSLPAITALADRFGARDFETVAVYHPKPPRAGVEDEDAIQAAAALGYDGPLAVDPMWTVLERIYLRNHRDAPTSLTFLLDRTGRVRYVHPGVEFGPTDDPRLEQVNQDYEDLAAAIAILIAEGSEGR